MGNSIEEIGKVIPEAYYDIMARVIPGAIVIIAYFPPW
jgi:hypothetical protein